MDNQQVLLLSCSNIGYVTSDQPTLVTERLLLRPLKISDAKRVSELAGHRDIAAQSIQIPHPYSEQDAEKWIVAQSTDPDSDTHLNFAITTRSNGDLVGVIGLLHIKPEHESAELGYWIGKPFWNRGYATEAVGAIVDYAFCVLGLNRVYSQYMSENPASGKVLNKCGFVHEGTLRQHLKKWGKYEDIEMAAIIRDEYPVHD